VVVDSTVVETGTSSERAITDSEEAGGVSDVADAAASCLRQSPSNLVPTGGFDQGQGGWIGGRVGTEDAGDCSTSYSLHLLASQASSFSGDSISPCFVVSGAAPYEFGATIKRVTGRLNCTLLAFAEPEECERGIPNPPRTIDSMHFATFESPRLSQWAQLQVEIKVPDGGFLYSRIDCMTDGEGFVDRVFVSPVGQGF
jgi:hypothetical protein